MLGCDSAGTAERSHRAFKARGSSREELPPVQGQGRQMGGATLGPRPEAVAERSYPASEIKGGQEEPHHFQGAVATRGQEGLEEPSYVEGPEGRP